MNDEDLRDCFAMFAMTGIIMTGFDDVVEKVAKDAYKMADAMLEARKHKEKEDEDAEDVGIARVAKRTYRRKS